MTPDRLATAAADAFAAARAAVGGDDLDGSVAGRTVRSRFAGDAFRAAFAGSLALAPVDDRSVVPDLVVHAWDGASTGAGIRSDSWLGTMLGPAGRIDDLSDERYQVSLDLHASLVSILDTRDGMAWHYAPDARRLPPWEETHPARMLWAAWARARRMLLCHAAAVGEGGRGVLLVGASGSGKSTTTLACLAGGLTSAGDDYVLVEPGEPPRAHALFRSVSLEAGHARRFPSLLPAVDRVAAMTPERHKAVMTATGGDRPTIGGTLSLSAIVVPRVEPGSTSAWGPASAASALRALAPSTMSQLGMLDAAAFRDLGALCRALPCYALRLGRDVERLPELVRSILLDAGTARRAATGMPADGSVRATA